MNKKIKVVVDGKTHEIEEGKTYIDLMDVLGLENPEHDPIIVVEEDNVLKDVTSLVKDGAVVKFYRFSDQQGKHVFWHSSAHILAQAVLSVFPDAKPTIGPALDDGFYYDFYVGDKTFNDEDLKKIEKAARQILKKGVKFKHEWIPMIEAKKFYEKEVKNTFKLELLEEIEDDPVSFYVSKSRAGEFKDLCRGPHIPPYVKIKAFKVLQASSAYWRGKSDNPSLQRVYAITFPTKEQLEEYVKRLEEASKRDHRKLGKTLDLFMFSEYSPGTAFFTPKGQIIWDEIGKLLKEETEKLGYQYVRTPYIYKKPLWDLSGHAKKYSENMFWFHPEEGVTWGLKPMNCPGHALLFRRRIPSYHELPIKYAEFGFVHRNELSGTLQGLQRVIGFTQDDAHIFMLEDQVEEQLEELFTLVFKLYKIFGLEDFRAVVSTRPETFIGDIEVWNRAEAILKQACENANLKWSINEGDGAFYGPKIDFYFKDAIGREWQLTTIQLDFYLGKNLDAKYMGKDGKYYYPIVIHRAILGSFERFIGIYLEHTAGALPVWLSPVQVELIPISTENEKIMTFTRELEEILREQKIRVHGDYSEHKMQKKIRNAQLQKIPYMIVIGEKEAEAKVLSIRRRDNTVTHDVKIEEFIAMITEKIKTYSREL